MLPKTKTERHADICKEINALYAMKNHDYGDSFHQTFTEENLKKLEQRYPEGFDPYRSQHRNELGG